MPIFKSQCVLMALEKVVGRTYDGSVEGGYRRYDGVAEHSTYSLSKETKSECSGNARDCSCAYSEKSVDKFNGELLVAYLIVVLAVL
jgi:hypothetical protein